jgi:hypothetical protein
MWRTSRSIQDLQISKEMKRVKDSFAEFSVDLNPRSLTIISCISGKAASIPMQYLLSADD